MRAVRIAVVAFLLCGAASPWERKAREHWFHFEIAESIADWRSFHETKLEEEAKLEKAFKKSGLRGDASSPQQARARRVLALEFEQVAKARVSEAEKLAKRVLADMKTVGDEFPHRSCMYGNDAEGQQHFQRFMQREKAKHEKVAAKFAGTFARPRFRWPAPDRGMPGKVTFSFGKVEKPPKGKSSSRWGPNQPEIELWWEGQVMPAANGPLFERPTSPHNESEGEWVYYRINFPYSRDRNIRLR